MSRPLTHPHDQIEKKVTRKNVLLYRCVFVSCDQRQVAVNKSLKRCLFALNSYHAHVTV